MVVHKEVVWSVAFSLSDCLSVTSVLFLWLTLFCSRLFMLEWMLAGCVCFCYVHFNVPLSGVRQKQRRLHRRAGASADDERTRSHVDVWWRHSNVHRSRLQGPAAHHLRRFLEFVFYFCFSYRCGVMWNFCLTSGREKCLLKVYSSLTVFSREMWKPHYPVNFSWVAYFLRIRSRVRFSKYLKIILR